ncbi:hypothetical protein RJT34_16361 [Clitoria ternatea]|uniref:F-box domain-containing protein n=1 Tax=Clitoria ternatea TaxID=43366 RepID=A0AAN9PC71_CLITE
MEHLPRELVCNVLSRLPAKVLMLCKCVCKSWFDLLTDPHFVANYYVVYNSLQGQEENLLVIRRPFFTGLKTYISLLSWNVDVNVNVSSHVLNPPYEYNSDHKYWTEIMGPCSGIYFLEGNPNVMMNPSLRQFRVLPESHFTSSPGTYSFSDYAGFGFDPKTHDFKVVVIKDLWLKESDERQLGYWTAELYGLNSNSWRKLDTALPLPIEIWGSSRVYTYVNNCCHWWGFVDHEDVVLAFDMISESFRKIKVPRIRCSFEEEFATLAPFDESATIGVIVYPVKGTDKCFDVWVMRDYWDEGSWVKQYTVGPVQVIYKLVGFYGSNRFLWKDTNERLMIYDSEQTRDLQVYGKYDSLRAARYMESLVSLERENQCSDPCFSCSLVPDPLLYQSE